ncbi:MAG: cysteine-rich CWC family protein [Bacteroidales bacterium]|nr:cysteine-rich CWC family protein [Bacteroidales bacterium]
MVSSGDALKRCPSCGSFFSCNPHGDCWCEEFRIHRKEMIQLMQQYTDCICPACLKKYAAE